MRGNELGIRSSIILRVVVVTILLGSGVIIYYGYGLKNEAFYLALIIALVYFLSLFYLFTTPFFLSYSQLFKGAQIAIDIVLASAVIFITGGSSSPFIFLYALVIIFASIMFTRVGSYIAALVSGLLYILIVLYQFHLEFPSGISKLLLSDPRVWGETGLLDTYFNFSGFIMVAVLSGYLSDRMSVARKELGESKKNLSILKNLHENILQSLTTGVITLDLQGRVISINKKGFEILGVVSNETFQVNELNYVIPGLDIDDLLEPKKDHILYTRPDGRKLTLGFSTSILKDNEDDTQGYIIVFEDLTEVKELENRLRSSEKMALLGQLSAGLAHKIRNPLSAMSGAAEVLRDEVKPSEENIRLLKVASQEVERLNLIVEDFLVLTTPIHNVSSYVDLDVVINETTESFLRSMNRNGIDIEVNNDKGIFVQADSYRLKQAMWNLLHNAMDAMPGGGKIFIESHLNGNDITVKVSDRGSGIDENIINKIFDPFFTTKQVGTGLGLAIVQKVIEGYHGKISVISSKSNGTTFIMTFPNADRDTKEATL
ncbi:MAG: nitrogen regulation protein NR(II) [Thermodesulfobacteriota bacterium]